MTGTALMFLLTEPVTIPPSLLIVGGWILWGIWGLCVSIKAWVTQPIVVPAFAERTAQKTPGFALRFLAQTERRLISLGFDTVARLQIGAPGTTAPAYLLLSRSPTSGEEARAVVRYSQRLNTLRECITSLEFVSARETGQQLITSNSAVSDTFLQPGYLSEVHCPDVHDPALLYAIHRYRVTKGGAALPLPPAASRLTDPIGYLHKDYRRVCEAQVRAGILCFDPAKNAYRKTWRGIFQVGWRMVWPIRPVRAAYCRLAEHQLIRAVRKEAGQAAA